jgi:transmembrane sensor
MKTIVPNEDRVDHAVTPDVLKQQAWDWLRLLHSGQASAEDAQGFRNWVQSSPAHQATYNDVKQRWDALKRPAGALLKNNPDVAAYYQQTRRAQSFSVSRNRRAFLGVAASAVAVAGVAVVYPPLGLWPAPSQWNADYRTATGEQRTLALADSVDVTLNTQTSIRRQTAGSETVGVNLIAGEAAVDLRRAGRPFAVVAGDGRSVAESGRFEVRYLAGKVCVTCIDGAVRVEHPAGDRLLQARQQTIYDAASVSSVAAIDPANVSAWRKGLLVFHQTRLADAVDEINRYRSGRVMLMNAVAGNKAVSGHFSIASLDLALTQLQHVFGLNARSLPGGLVILS